MEKIEEGGDSGFLDLVALDSRIRHSDMIERGCSNAGVLLRSVVGGCSRGTGEETERRRGGNG